MIAFELIAGLLVIGLLALIAVFFTKASRKRAGLSAEQSRGSDDGVGKPANKSNMKQPQEEFIAPESATGKSVSQ